MVSVEAYKMAYIPSEKVSVSLGEYRGKNVLLVFCLGPERPHCLRQLHP
jgi:hypothetical protein